MTDAATVAVLRGLLVGSDVARSDGDATLAAADWTYVERFLVHHALAGLAVSRHRRARAAGGRSPMPDAVAAVLEPYYVSAALQTQVCLETAHRVRTVLSDAEVPSLAFKGAALASDGTYADPGERVFEDVDVLIAPGDADRAVTALVGAGFTPWVAWDHSRLYWLSSFTLDDTHAPRGVPCTVDLHWSTLYGSLRIREPSARDPLWRGADVARGLPTPEAHFTLIADHFLKHLRVIRHLRGLGDLARLAPRLRDPEALLAHARARGGEGRLLSVSRALRHLYGVGFPTEVAAALGPIAAPTASENRYLGPERLLGTFGRPVGRISGLVMRWRLDRSAADPPLHQVLEVLRPPDTWLRSRYPNSAGGALRLRARYSVALVAWALGLGPSPLSPNQDAWHASDDKRPS